MKMKSTVILRPRELQNAVVLLVERDVAPLSSSPGAAACLEIKLKDVVSHPFLFAVADVSLM